VKNKFLLFVLIFFIQFCYPQNKYNQQKKTIDSLILLDINKKIIDERSSVESLKRYLDMYYRSKSFDYDKGILHSIFELSTLYIFEQNYEEALKRIPEGISLAKKSEDYDMICKLLVCEGLIYSKLGYERKAKQSFDESINILTNSNIKDDKHFVMSVIYGSIGLGSTGNKKIIYLTKGYNESNKIAKNYPSRNLSIASFNVNMALYFVNDNNVEESEKNLKEFERRMSHEKNKSFFIKFYQVKGLIENKKGHYIEAINYFNRSINLIKEYNFFSRDTESLYNDIAASYMGLKNYQKQSFYLLKASKVNDSISTIEKKILSDVLYKQNKTVINNNIKSYKSIYIVIAVFIIGIIFFVGSQFFFKIKKYRELTYMQEKQFLPSQNIQEEPPACDLKELIELVKNNDKSFHLRFSEFFITFNQRLLDINPQLTLLDLELCALIKLKFDTKEIAKYRNISVNSVESRKYRIRKKLNINTNENIYTWMLNIE